MGKVRNEILELKQSGVSVNEVLERMMSRRMMLAASAVVIAGLLLSACGYSPTTEVPNSTATTGPQITETIPANGTPGTTETPFVEVTPGVENEKVVEIMKQVDLFLKEESPYTESQIDSKMFMLNGWKGEVELGILNAYDDETGLVEIQGMVLDNIVTDDGIIVFLGVQDIEGSRFVTPVKIYDELFNIHKTENDVVGFSVVKSTKDLKVDWNNIILIENKTEMTAKLNENQGEAMVFQVTIKANPTLPDDIRNQMVEAGYIDIDLTQKQLNDLRDNTRDATKNLVLSLWCQSLENFGSVGSIGVIDSYGDPKDRPISITNTEDVFELIESNSWMPMSLVAYFQ